jgi:hypothetical protein
MHPNEQLINDFYAAFGRLDAESMATAYTPDAHFTDPVFADLNGPEVPAMWAMLTGRSTGIALEVSGVEADDRSGRASWVARYKFGPSQRPVTNRVSSAFEFSGGRIQGQRDTFDFRAWAAMALGTKGRLFGWTPLVQRATQSQAAKGLAEFMAKH